MPKMKTLTIGDTTFYVEGDDAAPRNLLDNSDFTNPVNQRGFTSGEVGVNAYCIDRWLIYDDEGLPLSVVLSENGVTLSPNGDAEFAQFISNISKFYGKTLTAVICLADGSIHIAKGICPSEPWKQVASTENELVRVVLHTFDGDKGAFFIRPSQSITVVWAAVYEGEYTLDTLPEYQSKGYGTELAECMRYYQQYDANWMSAITDSSGCSTHSFTFPVPMRVNPTVNCSNNTEQQFDVFGVGLQQLLCEYVTTNKQTTYIVIKAPNYPNFCISARFTLTLSADL